MVKAADILLAAPSVHRHIYFHVTSVPKTWPLISRISKKATWALDPFTSPFQILTVASNLCKLIPSSVINTHTEHKRGGVSRGLEEPWQYFSTSKDLGSSEWTCLLQCQVMSTDGSHCQAHHHCHGQIL